MFNSSETCTQCKTMFSLFTRKHHCRRCFQIYCNSCSNVTESGTRMCRVCNRNENGNLNPLKINIDGEIILPKFLLPIRPVSDPIPIPLKN